MGQFFITCKESRIENNRSFYGCFYLGPFEPGQSITVANALRRTLLSQITGIAIVSVNITNVLHEYSTLPGVKDSVLDILLNLKEIVLKKNNSINKNLKRPQVGYLRARGPGVVKAKDLRLPPFIQCVDPEQHIATLTDDGVLDMKFLIQEGYNFVIQKPNSAPPAEGRLSVSTINKKRRLLLKTIKQELTDSQITGKLWPEFSLINNSVLLSNSKQRSFLPSAGSAYASPLNKEQALFIDAIFNPITKVNYIIEISDYKTIDSAYSFNAWVEKFERFCTDGELDNPILLNSDQNLTNMFNLSAVGRQRLRFGLRFANSLNNSINNNSSRTNYTSSTFDKLNKELAKESSFITNSSLVKKDIQNKNQNFVAKQQKTPNVGKIKQNLKNFSDIYLANFVTENLQNKSTTQIKHNVILEIWTNGSIHPRDALYSGFKHLISLFSNLGKTQTSFNKAVYGNKFDGSVNTYQEDINNYLNYSQDKDFNVTNSLSLPIYAEKLNFDPQNLELETNSSLNNTNLQTEKINLTKFETVDIGSLNISIRSYTCLKRSNINTLADLLKLSKQDLLAIRNLGQKSVKEIENSLIELGLTPTKLFK